MPPEDRGPQRRMRGGHWQQKQEISLGAREVAPPGKFPWPGPLPLCNNPRHFPGPAYPQSPCFCPRSTLSMVTDSSQLASWQPQACPCGKRLDICSRSPQWEEGCQDTRVEVDLHPACSSGHCDRWLAQTGLLWEWGGDRKETVRTCLHVQPTRTCSFQLSGG